MHICARCTTNPHLAEWITHHAIAPRCRFCAAEQPAADIGAFTAHVDAVIRRFHSHDEEGEFAEMLIARAAGISTDIARLVLQVPHDGESTGHTFYDYGPLAFSEPLSLDHSVRWKEFRELVKHDTRFFGTRVRTMLDAMLGDLSTFLDGAALRELGLDTVIFRGRLAKTAGEARAWFETPALNLNAPPSGKAVPQRMNTVGIRVFYGALQEQIVVAELRPTLGSQVVVGSFAPTRPLRVLDLGVLRDVRHYEDLFSARFDWLSARLIALRMLERDLSAPVQPHDEPLDYLPTQVVAEYVAIVLGLDGIAYRSAQLGEFSHWGPLFGPPLPPEQRNIVLFRTAAVTEPESAPAHIVPGLRFLPESQQMFDVTRIEVRYEHNMWAHYVDPPLDDETLADPGDGAETAHNAG